MKTGSELIAEERARQISHEGWTPAHDDEHTEGELLRAAIAYSMATVNDADYDAAADSEWPWEASGFKVDSDIRNLVKAGALIAAEIDRLQRRAAK
jgi:hypothetical protein